MIGQNGRNNICNSYNEGHIPASAFLIEARTIGYVALFASAYKNSSIDKKWSLSQKSDETQIVDCASQPHRAISPRNSPGYVSPPMIQVCQQAVEAALNADFPENPPLPSPQPSPQRQGLLAGQTPAKNPLLVSENNEEYGVVPDPDDEIPDPHNRPPLVSPGNLPRFGSSFPGGGYNPGGGGPGGGGPGGGWGGPEDGADSGFSYAPGAAEGLSSDSFAGGEAGLFAGGAPGGGYNPGGGGPGGGYREPGSEGKAFDSGGAPFGDSDGLASDSDGSIFQFASRRIQQFCSDHSCIK